jgi:trigger factor
MEHSLERLPKNQVKITITVSKPEVQAGMSHAVEHMGAEISIPGFRPGHAPASAIRAKIGEDKLFEHAIEEIIRDSFAKVLIEEDLATVGQPFFAPVKMSVGEEFIYSAEVSLMPSVTKLGDYKKINITPEAVSVTPEEFNRAKTDLLRLRQTEAATEEGYLAQKGDKITIDMTMKKDGVSVEGGDAKDHHVFTGEDHYIPGFAEALLGSKVGDNKTFSLEFPKDHPQKMLADQAVEFTALIKSINQLVLPAWDDNLAKSLGLESVAALETKLTDNLKLERQTQEDTRQERVLLETLANQSSFDEFSDLLVNQEIDKMLQELKQWTEEQGVEFDTYLKSLGKSLADIKLDFTPQAIMRLKVALVIEEIAKKEAFTPDEAKIDAEIDRLAQGIEGNEAVKQYIYSPGFRERITAQERNKQVITQLKSWNLKQNG